MTQLPPQPAPESSGSLQLDSTLASVRVVQDQLMDAIRKAGYDDSSAFAIRLSLEEAMTNAVRHGNKGIDDAKVELAWQITPSWAEFSIKDEGPGFDPDALPDPTDPEMIERPHGRGVMLIRAYMTTVTYEDEGRCVRMRYEKPS